MNNLSKSNMVGLCWEKLLNTQFRQALNQKITISKSIFDGFTINCGRVKQYGKKYSIMYKRSLFESNFHWITIVTIGTDLMSLRSKKRQIQNCGRSNWQRQTFRKNIQSIEKVIWMKTSHDRNCFFKTFFFQPCKVKYYGFQGSVICLIFANLPFLAPISTVTCIIQRFDV